MCKTSLCNGDWSPASMALLRTQVWGQLALIPFHIDRIT